MHVSVERTVAEGKRRRSHVFFEYLPRIWLMYATILLTTVPALVMESTVEGDISDFTIQVGGRVSCFGLICGVCFVVYDLFRAAHGRRSLENTVTDKDMVFFNLSEPEIRYGIRSV